MSYAGNECAVAQYVIDADGNKHSEHVYFADAIKEGLLLRERHPQSELKVRDLSQSSSADMCKSGSFQSPALRSNCISAGD